MIYQLNKLCAVLGVLLVLAFMPRSAGATARCKINLDIVTNYPGVSYAYARSELLSTLTNGARWGIIGWSLPTHLSGTYFTNHGDDVYCLPGTYAFDLTTQHNYYIPGNPEFTHTEFANTTNTYFYVPYSNTLAIIVSGPATPIEWTLSAPAEFANSLAYRTSGSNSMDLIAVPTGTYSVILPTVRGYAMPVATSTNITSGSPLINTLALDYLAYSNSLAVTVSGITSGSNAVLTLTGPAEFTNAASFGSIFTNSFTVAAIPTGLYTVTFPAVVGYTAPGTASTNITVASPLINCLTGLYASVIWGTNTSTNTPATNFPVFTNAITLMVDNNGLFQTPSREKIIAANGLATNGAGGIPGPQGPPGSNGVDGAQGPQGPPGTNGMDGAQGPQGPAGSNGLDGVDGSNGVDGVASTITVAWVSNGLPGSVASVINVGSSNAAALGFVIPAGSNGADGAQGATGPQGPAGSNGVGALSATYPVFRLPMGGAWTDFELKASTNNFTNLVYFCISSGTNTFGFGDTNALIYFSDDYQADVRAWRKSPPGSNIYAQLSSTNAVIDTIYVFPSHDCQVVWSNWMSQTNKNLVWSWVRFDGFDFEKNFDGTKQRWNLIQPDNWELERKTP